MILKDADLLEAYGQELVQREVAALLFDQDERLARMFARSGFFSDIKGAEPMQAISQAMTKIQLGRSWAMTPADAMQHVFFVNGRPAVQNEYLGSQMRSAGMDWKIRWHRNKEGECVGVTLYPMRLTTEGSRPIKDLALVDGKMEEVDAEVTFTKADADRIKVKEDGKYISLSQKSTYQSYPEDMYFWRAIARLRRRYATNVLTGVITLNEAEEIEAPDEPKAPVKMDIPQIDIRPSRGARNRAGVPEVPNTVAGPAEPPEIIVEPSAGTGAMPTQEPQPEPPVETPKAPPASPAAPNGSTVKANLIEQIKAIRIARGDSLFTGQLFKISPKITPENFDKLEEGQLRSVLNSLGRMAETAEPPVASQAPKKPLFDIG
jgi:hypothetical protein